jgi:hypothetical protein
MKEIKTKMGCAFGERMDLWETKVRDEFHFLFSKIPASSWLERYNIITSSLSNINLDSIQYVDFSICLIYAPNLGIFNEYCKVERAENWIKENMDFLLFHFHEKPDFFSFIFLKYTSFINQDNISKVLPFLVRKESIALLNLILSHVFGIQIVNHKLGINFLSKTFTSREEAISGNSLFIDSLNFLLGLIEVGDLDRIKFFLSQTTLTIEKYKVVYSSCSHGHLHLIKFFLEEKAHCLVNVKTTRYEMTSIKKSIQSGSFECVKFLSENYSSVVKYSCRSFFLESLKWRNMNVCLYFYNRLPKDQDSLEHIRKWMSENWIAFPILRELI